MTLTIPTPDLPIAETRAIVNYAWSLLRKRSLLVALVRGGAKSEEFTVTKNGYHYHLHLLIYSKYFTQKELRKIWTECVRSAYAKYERNFKVNTEHGELIVDIRAVTNTERSVRETCKYITKTANWSQVNRRDLIELALIHKWHRMFELFGSFALRNTEQSVVKKPSLDTRSSSDGWLQPSRDNWRMRVQNTDVEAYLIDLEFKIERARDFGIKTLRQKFPNHRIYVLSCLTN